MSNRRIPRLCHGMMLGLNRFLTVSCMVAGMFGLAHGADGPGFTVTNDHDSSLLPTRQFVPIDALRFETIRSLTEGQLHNTINLRTTDTSITVFAARMTWQPHDLVVNTFTKEEGEQQGWKVASLSLYLVRKQESGLWDMVIIATGADGTNCRCEKYSPTWLIAVGDLIASYYLKTLPTP